MDDWINLAIKAALETPGATRFLAAAGFTRAALGLIGISLVLLARPEYGYATAGKLAGAFVTAAAVSKLLLTTWADRRGQSVVLALSVPLQAIALGAIVLAVHMSAPVWVLFALAVVAGGFESPAGAFSRARWLHALDDPAVVKTAFSIESTVDEAVFVVGPVVATTLAAAYGGGAGLLLASLLIASGGLWLWSQRDTDPGPVADPVAPWRVLSTGTLLGVTMSFCIGVMFGLVDISVLGAFEDPASGQNAASGLVLSAWAGAGVASGVLLAKYASRIHVPDLKMIAVAAVGATACLGLAVAAHETLPLAAVFIAASGLFSSPMLISVMHYQQSVAPSGAVTSALGLVSSAITGGVAAGLAIGGSLVDVFWVFSPLTAAACVCTVLCLIASAAARVRQA